MIQEPEETTGQPEVEEVVDAEVVSAADPAVEDAVVVEDAIAEEAAAEATVESDLAALVEEARSQRDEYLDLAQRTKADFDNYRKRVAAESQAQIERGRLEVVSGLIEAIDNLERVLEAAGIEQEAALGGSLPEDAPVTRQGVIVAYRDLQSVLRKAGVEAFDSKGEAFDPNLHEALQALPAEGVESGVVIEEMQKGYRAGESVIRHARVVVSQ
ncbi:MAG TPA: nucleotide exchange factor GrpE [Solirubrobacterales bacterium]|nr:nucleotide exchange factor GrpE [Solirubrobacterales bacterium]HMU27188.1 nucleotide exchange factor GrpE [Solirubrobacterales bacterium]HMW44869.1 nucleotide exchange factor GrpE [Solirubrobacterales bacterium]HMX72258.1 nucleotide exchange factor GrpE [Solirubrobacterales bacterium]HMY26655.1 nucleotide exchange factor GrpE [Solirubrobacterales bacterium]